MKYFHGENKAGPYFEGWYLKHQSKDGRALALIPALHIDSGGRSSASLQVISGSRSWWLEYPLRQLHASRDRFSVRLGASRFNRQGMVVDICQDGLSLKGTLAYGPFTPLTSDIMGPFRLLAGMQCSHGVISMGHSLTGQLTLNGEVIDFTGGRGYIETDRGRSFPEAYLWTQCAWEGTASASLMLAAATVPLPVGSFTGCICAVLYNGEEYRLATYRGAKIERWSPAMIAVRQGSYRLIAKLQKASSQPLQAPVDGSMRRTIRESLCAEVRYCFWKGQELLFRHTDRCASFEYSRR